MITLTLTRDTVNIILNALEEYPYNRVASIIQHITEQREVVT